MPELTDGDGVPIPHEYTTDAIIAKLISGDDLLELVGVRDFLIHELTVSRCSSCQASKLRTGDTAALTGKLTAALEKISELRKTARLEEAARNGEVKGVAAIRGRRTTGGSEAPNTPPTKHGSKSSDRRTSPHRRNARS